jgi:hypothetical protein
MNKSLFLIESNNAIQHNNVPNVYDHRYSSVKAGGAAEQPLLSWHCVFLFCEFLVRMRAGRVNL